MAMLGECMHARPDAVADHRPSIASAVCFAASHDLDIGQSVVRLPVAARLAMARPLAVTQNHVIRSEGLATSLIQRCALAATFMLHAALAPHCSRKMEDERGTQGIALQAS
jgi:hypothetical protein